MMLWTPALADSITSAAPTSNNACVSCRSCSHRLYCFDQPTGARPQVSFPEGSVRDGSTSTPQDRGASKPDSRSFKQVDGGDGRQTSASPGERSRQGTLPYPASQSIKNARATAPSARIAAIMVRHSTSGIGRRTRSPSESGRYSGTAILSTV